MKKISVIMSTFNETEKDLDKAISSILMQTYQNIEFLIICDNPNNKKLVSLLKQYEKQDKRIILYINPENVGLTSSLNVGLKLSTGDYIARMDADDFSLPMRLEEQLQYLEKEHLDLVGCYVECVDIEGKSIYEMKNMPKDPDSICKKAIMNNPLAHPTWFGTKAIFIKNQGYREVPYAEDYDFILRALEKGARLGNLDQILFKYTLRNSSISKSNGLKQYIISKKLTEKYRDSSLSSCNIEEIKESIRGVTKKDEKKYANAAENFNTALIKIKSKNISCVFYLMKATLQSKYHFCKMIGYVRAFI